MPTQINLTQAQLSPEVWRFIQDQRIDADDNGYVNESDRVTERLNQLIPTLPNDRSREIACWLRDAFQYRGELLGVTNHRNLSTDIKTDEIDELSNNALKSATLDERLKLAGRIFEDDVVGTGGLFGGVNKEALVKRILVDTVPEHQRSLLAEHLVFDPYGSWTFYQEADHRLGGQQQAGITDFVKSYYYNQTANLSPDQRVHRLNRHLSLNHLSTEDRKACASLFLNADSQTQTRIVRDVILNLPNGLRTFLQELGNEQTTTLRDTLLTRIAGLDSAQAVARAALQMVFRDAAELGRFLREVTNAHGSSFTDSVANYLEADKVFEVALRFLYTAMPTSVDELGKLSYDRGYRERVWGPDRQAWDLFKSALPDGPTKQRLEEAYASHHDLGAVRRSYQDALDRNLREALARELQISTNGVDLSRPANWNGIDRNMWAQLQQAASGDGISHRELERILGWALSDGSGNRPQWAQGERLAVLRALHELSFSDWDAVLLARDAALTPPQPVVDNSRTNSTNNNPTTRSSGTQNSSSTSTSSNIDAEMRSLLETARTTAENGGTGNGITKPELKRIVSEQAWEQNNSGELSEGEKNALKKALDEDWFASDAAREMARDLVRGVSPEDLDIKRPR